jgi:hypothetical protein
MGPGALERSHPRRRPGTDPQDLPETAALQGGLRRLSTPTGLPRQDQATTMPLIAGLTGQVRCDLGELGLVRVYPLHLGYRFSGCPDLGAGQGGITQAYHSYGKYF